MLRSKVVQYVLEGDPRICAKEAGSDHGAVGQEVEREESLGCPESLPCYEEYEQDDAEDNHANDHGCAPAFALVGCETEGEEEDREAATDQ